MSVPVADIQQIGQYIIHARSGRILTTAASLGIFDAMGKASLSAQAIADRIRADARTTEVLLDALVALGLAHKQENAYRNTAAGLDYLTSDGSRSLAHNLCYQEKLAQAWASLPEIIRSGKPTASLEHLLAEEPQFTREYIRGMADIARRPAQELAGRLELNNCQDALDVGGGPAAYARAMIEAAPHLKVVLLDLEPTLRIAEALLQSWPHRDRIALRAGNYHEADFGDEAFDLVLMSHITHDEGAEANGNLLKKAYRALRTGGRVVIHDFMLDADRTNPPFGALFSVHLLTYTREGRTYSVDEYTEWLIGCGFRDPRRIEICPDSPNPSSALIAVKS